MGANCLHRSPSVNHPQNPRKRKRQFPESVLKSKPWGRCKASDLTDWANYAPTLPRGSRDKGRPSLTKQKESGSLSLSDSTILDLTSKSSYKSKPPSLDPFHLGQGCHSTSLLQGSPVSGPISFSVNTPTVSHTHEWLSVGTQHTPGIPCIQKHYDSGNLPVVNFLTLMIHNNYTHLKAIVWPFSAHRYIYIW